MINFKEYLVENWGNLSKIPKNIMNDLKGDLRHSKNFFLGRSSKVITIKNVKDLPDLKNKSKKYLKTDNNILITNGDITYFFGGALSWQGSLKTLHNPLPVKGTFYIIHSDMKSYKKSKKRQDANIQMNDPNATIDSDTTKLLYNQRVKQIIKDIEKKYGKGFVIKSNYIIGALEPTNRREKLKELSTKMKNNLYLSYEEQDKLIILPYERALVNKHILSNDKLTTREAKSLLSTIKDYRKAWKL